jgi:hypothetical protein
MALSIWLLGPPQVRLDQELVSNCFCQFKIGPVDHRKQGHFGFSV